MRALLACLIVLLPSVGICQSVRDGRELVETLVDLSPRDCADIRDAAEGYLTQVDGGTWGGASDLPAAEARLLLEGVKQACDVQQLDRQILSTERRLLKLKARDQQSAIWGGGPQKRDRVSSTREAQQAETNLRVYRAARSKGIEQAVSAFGAAADFDVVAADELLRRLLEGKVPPPSG